MAWASAPIDWWEEGEALIYSIPCNLTCTVNATAFAFLIHNKGHRQHWWQPSYANAPKGLTQCKQGTFCGCAVQALHPWWEALLALVANNIEVTINFHLKGTYPWVTKILWSNKPEERSSLNNETLVKQTLSKHWLRNKTLVGQQAWGSSNNNKISLWRLILWAITPVWCTSYISWGWTPPQWMVKKATTATKNTAKR